MNNVFQHDITWLRKEYDHEAETPGTWKHTPVTMPVTFMELDQTDRDQHLYHFDVMAFFGGKKKKPGADEDVLNPVFDAQGVYDLTAKYVKKFTVLSETFTAGDREEILNDSGALLNFGLWLVEEKIVPFFRKLRTV